MMLDVVPAVNRILQIMQTGVPVSTVYGGTFTGYVTIIGSTIQVPVQLQSTTITVPITGTIGVLGTANVNVTNITTGYVTIIGSTIEVPVQLQSSLITVPVTGTVGVLGTANVNIAGSSITVPVQGNVTVQPSTRNLLAVYNVVYPASTAYAVSLLTPAPGKVTIDFVSTRVTLSPEQVKQCFTYGEEKNK